MPYVDVAGGRVRYEVTDITPPWECAETVLFHHGVATNLEIWSSWLPVITGRYRVVRFDMRGCGESSVPDAQHDWSMDQLLNDIIAVADAAQAASFHYIGESLGGTLGYALAARKPSRVLSLTVSNGAPRGGSVRNLSGWDDLMAISHKRWSDQMMEWRFAPNSLTPAQDRWFRRQQESSDPESILAIGRLLTSIDLWPELAGINAPTLLLAPDSSPFIPVDVMREVHARIPGAELKVFESAKHGLPFSHGKACAEIFCDFVTRRAGNIRIVQ